MGNLSSSRQMQIVLLSSTQRTEAAPEMQIFTRTSESHISTNVLSAQRRSGNLLWEHVYLKRQICKTITRCLHISSLTPKKAFLRESVSNCCELKPEFQVKQAGAGVGAAQNDTYSHTFFSPLVFQLVRQQEGREVPQKLSAPFFL